MIRFRDLFISLLALIILLPLLVILAVTVYLWLGPPIFFSQARLGLHGKPFVLRKFRTMRSLRAGEDLLATDAVRLTRLGRFLRSTSLDELPTLWNVLCGDMSLVGPRPLLPDYLPLYSSEQARRMEVRPGISGWAQVNGRNAISWEEKFRLDVWYVDNRSFLLDMKILWMTVWQVLSRGGITANQHATMPPFTGSADVFTSMTASKTSRKEML